jgi:hypothetical protein
MVSLENPYSPEESHVPTTCEEDRPSASSKFTYVLMLFPKLYINRDVKTIMDTIPMINLGFI